MYALLRPPGGPAATPAAIRTRAGVWAGRPAVPARGRRANRRPRDSETLCKLATPRRPAGPPGPSERRRQRAACRPHGRRRPAVTASPPFLPPGGPGRAELPGGAAAGLAGPRARTSGEQLQSSRARRPPCLPASAPIRVADGPPRVLAADDCPPPGSREPAASGRACSGLLTARAAPTRHNQINAFRLRAAVPHGGPHRHGTTESMHSDSAPRSPRDSEGRACPGLRPSGAPAPRRRSPAARPGPRAPYLRPKLLRASLATPASDRSSALGM